MLNREQAELLALRKIKELGDASKIELSLLVDSTVEFEYGWMFFYQSSEFVKTGDDSTLVGGNAPIIIDKINSSVVITGSRRSSEFYINNYCLYRDDLDKYKDAISW